MSHAPLPIAALLASMLAGAVLGASACLSPGAHVPAPPPVTEGERMVTVRGANLRVRDEGSGPPVVFVHGFGSRLESWRLVQPVIAAEARTIAFDQRGFGKSERPAGEEHYGVAAHAADLWALLDALDVAAGDTPVVLVGHSYGAGVVLEAALSEPGRVSAVVLVSPFVLDDQKNGFLRWAELPLLGEWLYVTNGEAFAAERMALAFAEPERFVTLDALEEIEENQRLPGTRFAALATVRGMDYTNARERYRTLSRPVFIVWGERDKVTPVRGAGRVTDALPGATLTRVPGVGHMPSWERPEAVINAVRAALLVGAP